MQTNFFSHLTALGLSGTLRLNVQPQTSGGLLVSLLLVDETVKDEALKLIPPLVLKGDANDLDNGFFEAIKAPVQQTQSLITNMGAYETAMGKAQQQSKEETNKKNNTIKEKDGKRRKFDEQMKKVNELEKQKKIGQAIGQLPDLKLFPEFADEIKKKGDELRKQHGSLSLFVEEETMDALNTPETNEERSGEEDDYPGDEPEEEEEVEDYQ